MLWMFKSLFLDGQNECVSSFETFLKMNVTYRTRLNQGNMTTKHLQGMIFWFWFFGRFSGFEPWRVEWPSTLHAVCQKLYWLNIAIDDVDYQILRQTSDLFLGMKLDLTWNSTRRRTGYFLRWSQCLTKLVTSTGLSAMAAIAFPSSAVEACIPNPKQIENQMKNHHQKTKWCHRG